MRVWYDGDLVARAIPKETNYWCIERSYVVRSRKHQIVIPRYYVTDFASIPRIFWSIIHPMDLRIAQIAAAHDRIYETHELSQSDADDLLYAGMLTLGASKFLAYMVWSGVRVGGWLSYKSGPSRREERQKRARIIMENEGNI